MTTRKDIRRVIIPAKYAQRFDESKEKAQWEIMTTLTDAQHVARLVCWALEQQGKKECQAEN
jgi:hypothetical protein